MDQQIDLDFARTHARRTDPHTSKAAARGAVGTADEHRSAIYWALLRASVPLTYEEIATRSGLDPVQVGRRLSEMLDPKKDGRVERLAETRPTRTGRAAHLWRLRKVEGARG